MLNLCLRLVALVFITFVVSSCQERIRPIYNPSNVSIPVSLATTSLEEIGTSIKQAGAGQNWKMTDIGSGKIEGILNIRAHQATVRIDYSLISYSITYVSSVNLNDVGYGIHKNYNSWIRDLESAINIALLERAQIIKNQSLNLEDKAMLEAWKRAEKSDNPLVLQDFIDEYGDGPFVSAAQDRLNLLAQQRVSGMKKYDPTGKWQVVVSYKGGLGNTSWCARDNRWVFVLDFRKGRISETFWSGKAALYVTGDNADDFVDLNFDYPGGGNQWTWTERFRLDSGDKHFTATSKEGGIPPGCKGTIGVHMTKQ